MHILNTVSAIEKDDNQRNQKLYVRKLLQSNEICKRKQVLFNETSEQKDLQLLATKIAKEKIPDSGGAKEYYNSYLTRKNIKSVKQLKNFANLKSVTIKHPKTD